MSPLFLLTERLPPELVRKRDQIDQQLEAAVRARLAEIEAGFTFEEDIILLLYGQNRGLGEAAMVRNMIDELKIFLVAGSDTTSTLVTNCLYYLTTVPHVHAKIL